MIEKRDVSEGSVGEIDRLVLYKVIEVRKLANSGNQLAAYGPAGSPRPVIPRSGGNKKDVLIRTTDALGARRIPDQTTAGDF